MVVKDLSGKLRMIPLKARKATSGEVTGVMEKMLKAVEKFNKTSDKASPENHASLNKKLNNIFLGEPGTPYKAGEKIYLALPHHLTKLEDGRMPRIKFTISAVRQWDDKAKVWRGPVTGIEISIDAVFGGQERKRIDPETGETITLSKHPKKSRNRINIPLAKLVDHKMFMDTINKKELQIQGSKFKLNENNFRLQLPSLDDPSTHLPDLTTNVKSTIFKNNRLKSQFKDGDFNEVKDQIMEKKGVKKEEGSSDEAPVLDSAFKRLHSLYRDAKAESDYAAAAAIAYEMVPFVRDIVEPIINADDKKYLTAKEIGKILDITYEDAKNLMKILVSEGVVIKGKDWRKNRFSMEESIIPEGDSPLDIIGGNESLSVEELIEKAEEIEALLETATGQVKQELEAEMKKILTMLPDQITSEDVSEEVVKEVEETIDGVTPEETPEETPDALYDTITTIIKNRALHNAFNELKDGFVDDHYDN
jgi:hypothetical protein